MSRQPQMLLSQVPATDSKSHYSPALSPSLCLSNSLSSRLENANANSANTNAESANANAESANANVPVASEQGFQLPDIQPLVGLGLARATQTHVHQQVLGFRLSPVGPQALVQEVKQEQHRHLTSSAPLAATDEALVWRGEEQHNTT